MKLSIITFLVCCSLIKCNYGMVKECQFSESERLAQLYLTQKSDNCSCFINWGLQYMQENRPDKALESFTAAAQKTTNARIKAEALFHIGCIYYFGIDTIKPDYKQALLHLKDPVIQQPLKRSKKIACPEKRAIALYHIGMIYLYGDETVEKDLLMAKNYLKAAAEQTDCPKVQIEAQEKLKELPEPYAIPQCVIL